ncbi:protocadherin gamma-A4-like [Rhinatrema bivittatum]|uniref:protocadherin gamma-A4-like n=1 Tax=Rhinatrema bivittatum TaxID=194408 RepID=UPI00112A7E38|nr:protocadherin gamma-A4-like [Rhinatrema bivittatum]
MAGSQRRSDHKARVLVCFIVFILHGTVCGRLRYSITEEVEKGSFVGNIAKDLGLDIRELSDRGARIVSGGKTQYFALDMKNGHLLVKEKIDRETICGKQVHCLLNLEILVEDTMKIYTSEVEIWDINDNAPSFPNGEIVLEISELTQPGTRYLLDAKDPDVGINSLQSYQLSNNKHFILDVQTGTDGVKYAELVLETFLDREKEADLHLTLTAADGGDPVRSGIVQIRVIVLDANDNAPVFNQSMYKVTVRENAPLGSVVVIMNATDLDEGINAEVSYLYSKLTDKASQIFQLDSKTGEISVLGNLDFEELESYELEVQAKDSGGLYSRSKVLLQVLDVNDNAPEVTITSLYSPVAENSPRGTAIALLNVNDQDSGQNGLVTCSIPDNLPFQLKKSSDSYYNLVTARTLDREEASEYNITITASDKGAIPLSTILTIQLQIADTNDNPPAFDHTLYACYIVENNQPGASVCSAIAKDPDCDQNAQIAYSIMEGFVQELPISSYVSINSNNGVIYALRSFDYEQFRDIQIQVKAEDKGSPPLSSNITVSLFIQDQNDNSPEILYPSFFNDGSTGLELAPRSVSGGFLVTKVVAVDADSGKNAWLSYHLLRATDPGLFIVGLHTGEIKAARSYLEKDYLKQILTVLVKDGGQPSRSTTVTLTIVFADSVPEIISNLNSISSPPDTYSNLTLYLVIAIAAVSCLFFSFIIVWVAIRLRRWRESKLFESSSVNFSAIPTSQNRAADRVEAYLQTYSHDVCLTTDSGRHPFYFSNETCSGTLPDSRTSEQKEFIINENEFNGCVGNEVYQCHLKKKNLEPNALLLLDNCPAHPPVDSLVSCDGKIKVSYLLKNTISKIQPLDQSIITTFKMHYRKILIKRIVEEECWEQGLHRAFVFGPKEGLPEEIASDDDEKEEFEGFAREDIERTDAVYEVLFALSKTHELE